MSVAHEYSTQNQPGVAETAVPAHPSGQTAPESTPSEVPTAAPAAPRFDPFAPQAPAVNAGIAGHPAGPQLPPCFARIEHQLPPVIRAKLRTVDLSTAHVVISTPQGKKSEAQPLTWFIEDFGDEAAQLIGRYGLLRVTVLEPGKQPWYFGIKVEAPEGEEANSGEDWREAMSQMLEMQQRFMENVKMELLLATGRAPQQQQSQDSFERELQRMRVLAETMRAMNPAADPGALIKTTFESMSQAMDGMATLRDKAAETVQPREADPIDQFNRLTENPLVQTGVKKFFEGAVGGRSKATAEGQAAPPKVDPFQKRTA